MYQSEASCEGRIIHELILENNREGSMFQTLQIETRNNKPNVTNILVTELEASTLPKPKPTFELVPSAVPPFHTTDFPSPSQLS
jgi:hypothetical protein